MRRDGALMRMGMIGFLLSITTGTVRAFANNLIVSSIGCMTELDTSEVIMNNVVISAEESDFPKIHLAVLDEDKLMESPYQYRPALGTTTAELTIVFVNPYTREEFPEKNDLQFVIQLQDNTPNGGPPGISGEFVSGGTIGCDGNQRVSARWKDNQGQVKRTRVRLGDKLGPGLGGGVRVGGLQHLVFEHGFLVRGAFSVDFVGGDVDETLHAVDLCVCVCVCVCVLCEWVGLGGGALCYINFFCLTDLGRFEEDVGAQDVVLGEGERVPKGVVDVGLGGEVHDGVDLFLFEDVVDEV